MHFNKFKEMYGSVRTAIYCFKIQLIFLMFIFIGESMANQKIENYLPKTKEYINTETTSVMKVGLKENMKVMKEVFFDSKNRRPKHKLPQISPNFNSFTDKSDKTKFIWFGHSTLLLNTDNKNILIDPVFSENAAPFNFMVKRFQTSVTNLEALPKIDTILISHNHYDHLDKKTIKFFEDKETKFIVPLGIKNILIKWGIDENKVTELDWYQSTKHGQIKFTATPAKHFSGRSLWDRNKTLWASWVIEGTTEKIFFSGDSGYGKHFKDIGKYFNGFDLAFIENGQYNEKWADIHMMPNETIQAAIDLDTKVFVPIHWGMFDLSLHKWYEPIEDSYSLAKEKKIPIIAPKLGEILTTEVHDESDLWWKSLIDNEENTLKLSALVE